MSTDDTAPATILVIADPAAMTRWLQRLVTVLQRQTGAKLVFRQQDDAAPGNSALAALFALERTVLHHGQPGDAEQLTDRIWLEGLHADKEVVPRLVIDLTTQGARDIPDGVPMLRPTYDGLPGENALAAVLFFSGTPLIAIERRDHLGDRPSIVAQGHASLEAAAGISGAIETVKSRVLTLLLKSIRAWNLPDPVPAPAAAQPMRRISAAAVAAKGGRMLAEAAARAAYHLCFHAPHWYVGWRFVPPGEDVFSRRDLGGAPWNRLPGPGDHFYADPFPFSRGGRDFVFVEDLDHRTDKGIISVVEFEDGKPGHARPVLEEECHLSYPFLIERDGQVFMIPETSLRREIAIYRAADFPLRWEKLAVLVSGVEAADATVFEADGIWWMMAVTRDGIGGYSDTLEIWTAPDLFGPWQAVETNPVLVDDRTARPAGYVIRSGDALYRPVQDCRARYGAALSLARIDRLDKAGFSQTVEFTLAPGSHWPGRRLHTLNYNGRLEVIDGEAPRLKWL